MPVLNRKKRKQRNARLRNLALTGAGVGVLGTGLLLARRKPPQSNPSPFKPVIEKPSTKAFPLNQRRRPNRPRIKPRRLTPGLIAPAGKPVRGGVLVHIPGKGRHHPDYYTLPVGRSPDANIERSVRLGKPGGRKRSKKNWNEWDAYRDTHRGAYNLRSSKLDPGRFRSSSAKLSTFSLSKFSPFYW
jgi:hypothetical protein